MIADKKFKQWQEQLDLFVDEKGLWRCRGRIEKANISYTTKYLVLLHNVHHLTALLIKKAHSRVLHNGVKEMLTELRSNFGLSKDAVSLRKSITGAMFAKECPIVLYHLLHYHRIESEKHPLSLLQEWILLDPCMSRLMTKPVRYRSVFIHAVLYGQYTWIW